jgi:hypothetical protein
LDFLEVSGSLLRDLELDSAQPGEAIARAIAEVCSTSSMSL